MGLRTRRATTSSVADTASSTTLLAENERRVGVTIYNESSAVLRIKAGATASATDYTWYVAANTQWTMPDTPLYLGVLDGIWASDSTGAARITEFTK